MSEKEQPNPPRIASWWTARPALERRPAYLLAALSGPLFAFAFAGIDIWPLAFICHVPLLVALRGQSVARATWLGLLWGFITTMIGFYWLVEMLEVFSGFPLPLCILFASILCVYQGGLFALTTHLYARAARRGWPPSLLFAGAFAAGELAYPLLFPWFFGACAHSVPILMQTADIGGPIAVSLVLVSVNLAFYALVERFAFKQPLARGPVVAGFGILALALVYGKVRISQVDAHLSTLPTFKVGMVQGNSKLHDRRNALQVHRKLTAKLRAQGAELVVWSEAAIPGAFDQRHYERDVPRRVTRGLGVPVVMGGVLYERLSPEERAKNPKGRRARFFNTALTINKHGRVLGRYDKQFLLMFGEYLPFGETFPVLYEMSPNSGAFSPGKTFDPLPLGEHRLSTMICYEDIIPSFVNKLVTKDTDLLVNLTNDAWFGDTTEPWIHLALAKFRPIEHRRYLVRVTNSGVSAIVDPVGRTVAQSEGTFTQEAILGEARYVKSETVYEMLGNAPWWLFTLFTVFAGFMTAPAERRRSQADETPDAQSTSPAQEAANASASDSSDSNHTPSDS